MRRLLLGGWVLAVALAGCSDAGETATSPPPPVTAEPPVTTAPPPPTTTTEPPPATTTEPPTTTTEPPASTTTSSTTSTSTTTSSTTTTAAGPPGAPYDLFVPTPGEGPVLGVVGVRFDDTLNVRAGPGVEFDVVGELAPTASGIAGTGQGWQRPDGAVWWEVEAGAIRGWASSRFLSRLDGTIDVTTGVVGTLGELPSAETMLELGELVASTFVDADVGSDVVQVTAPTVGDLGEIAFDVVGLADDSVGGVRLFVFGAQGFDGFTLQSVEATSFCTRGLAGGICV